MVFRAPLFWLICPARGARVVAVAALCTVGVLVVMMTYFNLGFRLESVIRFTIAITGATCGMAFQA
jgi:hypothetical protein